MEILVLCTYVCYVLRYMYRLNYLLLVPDSAITPRTVKSSARLRDKKKKNNNFLPERRRNS